GGESVRQRVLRPSGRALDPAGQKRHGAARMRPDEPDVRESCGVPAECHADDGARGVRAVFHAPRPDAWRVVEIPAAVRRGRMHGDDGFAAIELLHYGPEGGVTEPG